MQFYKLQTNPPRLVANQAEAKAARVPFVPVEVPTDKAGLLDYVNALLGAASAEPAALEAPAPVENTGERCPKCRFDHRSALRVAEHYARSVTREARLNWIETADPAELGSLAGAIADRFLEMKGL